MPDDASHFDEQGRLIAPRYDDVYFSAEDGLAETRHVFLEGNSLAERFASLTPGGCFTIGETGFGTGLNFLAAWQLFEQHAPAETRLEFVSVEGLPLGAETMSKALSPWPLLADFRDKLLEQWGPIWPGMHRFRFMEGRVRLTLLVGEVEEVLSSIDASVNAWFLDGFAPARNPEMWTAAVFNELARLSSTEATVATYTAAGDVRRGLEAVGYTIEKRPGFGIKRDMTVGRYAIAQGGGQPSLSPTDGRSATVIGASLAGSFAARSLAERGMRVTVCDRMGIFDGELTSLAWRTSLLQPKINDQMDPAGRWLRDGFGWARRLLGSDEKIRDACAWHGCGTFQAAYDEKVERRLRRFVEQFGDSGLCRWVEAEQTEVELGLQLKIGGVVVRSAGVLRPAGLCAGLLHHPNIRIEDGAEARSIRPAGSSLRVALSHDRSVESDVVVIANAMGAKRFWQAEQLDLRPIRGQVTMLKEVADRGRLAHLKQALLYGGYVTPYHCGVHTLGASFIPGDNSLDWRDSEHIDVCGKLGRVMLDEANRLTAMTDPEGWVGTRVSTPTHCCYAEEVDDGLYVSLGHGSHGIASAARAGEHLASLITGGPRARKS